MLWNEGLMFVVRVVGAEILREEKVDSFSVANDNQKVTSSVKTHCSFALTIYTFVLLLLIN